MKELNKTYNPADIEDRLYEKWETKKYFHAKVNPDKTPFTIVIPPPNITGQLHMGHALDNTMQDILIRYKRMAGYEALWLPGTDHAS
ncbi:MAG: class I tRNA ligase family protein, partial [Lachnospiraceae bacterium]|nr:class I tRNA ligase family protein [Lachnospiraceae bacterium]